MDTLTSQTDTKISTVCLLDLGVTVKTGFGLPSLTGWQPADQPTDRPSSGSCCRSSSPGAGGDERTGATGSGWDSPGEPRQRAETVGRRRQRKSFLPTAPWMRSKLSPLSFFLLPKDHPGPETSCNLFKGGFPPSGLRLLSPPPRADFLSPPPQSLDSKAAVQLYLPGTIITTVGGVAGRQSERRWKRKWRHHPAP